MPFLAASCCSSRRASVRLSRPRGAPTAPRPPISGPHIPVVGSCLYTSRFLTNVGAEHADGNVEDAMRHCPEKNIFLTAAMPFRALVPEPKVRPLNAPSRSQFASAMDDITERESDWLLVVFGGTEAQCRD